MLQCSGQVRIFCAVVSTKQSTGFCFCLERLPGVPKKHSRELNPKRAKVSLGVGAISPFLAGGFFWAPVPRYPGCQEFFFLIQALCGEPGKRGAKFYHTSSAVSFTLSNPDR